MLAAIAKGSRVVFSLGTWISAQTSHCLANMELGQILARTEEIFAFYWCQRNKESFNVLLDLGLPWTCQI